MKIKNSPLLSKQGGFFYVYKIKIEIVKKTLIAYPQKKENGMTIIAIWCRHKDDNIIGIGPKIPWHVSSDFKRFRRITEGASIIAGQTTYESFPNKTLPNRKIYVLTFNAEYEVSDKKNHFIITDINDFKNIEDTLYISGGASVYRAFMTSEAPLMPDIVIDCMYMGDLDNTLEGKRVDITPCIEAIDINYRQISQDYLEDNILTRVYVKKGEFTPQSTLKHIIEAIENKG